MILIHLWIICSPVSGTCLAEQSKPCANLAQTLRCLAVLLHLVGGPLLKENVKHANGTQMSRWSFFACYTFLESAHILYNNNISKINISIIGHLWGHVKTAVKLIHLCCSISRHVGPLFKAFKDIVATSLLPQRVSDLPQTQAILIWRLCWQLGKPLGKPQGEGEWSCSAGKQVWSTLIGRPLSNCHTHHTNWS